MSIQKLIHMCRRADLTLCISETLNVYVSQLDALIDVQVMRDDGEGEGERGEGKRREGRGERKEEKKERGKMCHSFSNL